MQGIERVYCDECIQALVSAWIELMEASGTQTLSKVPYGKGDTLGLDATTEIAISERIKRFDKHAFLITEELDAQEHRRWPTDSDPVKQPLMFFCDPTDGSNKLKKFFEHISKDDPTAKIGNLMASCDPEKLWEEMFEAPVCITGPTGAITCVRKGEVVFSVILSYLTGTVYVASDTGIFSYKLRKFSNPANKNLTFAEVSQKGKLLIFPSVRSLGYSADDCERFVTFLGKAGYRENLNDSRLFADGVDERVHHKEPTGPPRCLYFSELQSNHGPIGFIMANGEKIGEWMHWLTFVKYARDEKKERSLRMFEITLERPWTKNGMLMSTSPAYSVFHRSEDGAYIDISRLSNFVRPSQFLSMIVVARHDNVHIIQVLQQYQHRGITDFF